MPDEETRPAEEPEVEAHGVANPAKPTTGLTEDDEPDVEAHLLAAKPTTGKPTTGKPTTG